jgi:uncharacterized protein (TIGR03083 family)
VTPPSPDELSTGPEVIEAAAGTPGAGRVSAGGNNGRMDGSNLRQSARASTSFLTGAADLDWDVPIPDMTWSVREVVAHISEVLLWYSTDLSAGTSELSTMDLTVRPGERPDQLIATLTAFGSLLGHVVDGVDPGERGWHPDGLADPSGFAAMGCDEILVHTYDAALGLGLEFEPPEVLSRAVLRRLFPWAPRDTDTWQTLLWANGRRELQDRPRQVHWHRHPAPLSEWDGASDVEASARR